MSLPRNALVRRLCLVALPAAILLFGVSVRADDELQTKGEEDASQVQRLDVLRFRDRLDQVLVGSDEAPPAVSSYWIGIECQPVGAELREKLKLGPGEGVVVGEVMPDTPAAKAGLQNGDVIVSVGDRSLSSIEQLVKAIAEVKEGELKLQIARGDQRQAVTVRPAKRQSGTLVIVGEENEANESAERRARRERLEAERRQLDAARHKLEERLEQVQRARAAGGTAYQPQPGQPGAPIPAMAWVPPLPDDMEVTIHRRGSKPATITVRQGEKLWRTNEAGLDMLPDEARPYVGQMLGRPMPIRMPDRGSSGSISPGAPVPTVIAPAPILPGALPTDPALPGGPPPGIAPPPSVALPGTPINSSPQPIEVRIGDDGSIGRLTPAVQSEVIKLAPQGVTIGIREPEEKGAPQPPVRWLRVDRAPVQPDQSVEQKVRELQEEIEQLRRQLDELRKAADLPKATPDTKPAK